jgi:hypothetical protein
MQRHNKEQNTMRSLSSTRALLIAACVLAAAGSAVAQESPTFFRLVEEDKGYFHASVEKELFTNRQARNERKILVGKVCMGTESLRDKQADFDKWFKGYYYPMLTDPKQLPELAKLRRELMRDFFNRIKNDSAGLAVRDHLNKLSLEYLQKFAANNLHPAVRYNAMLIIGDLESRAAESLGGNKPAEPMNEALEVLRAELISPTQIDAVRVAALLGLRRHATLNRQRSADRQWTEATVTGLVDKIAPIAAAKKPPTGRSLEGHIWMRRLALETLAELGAARPLPAVTVLVDRIVGDATEPLDLRLAAAKAQGKLKNPLPAGAKPVAVAERIARVGIDAMIIDLEELKLYADQLEREELNSGISGGFSDRGFSAPSSGLGILEGSGSTSGKPEDAPVVRDPRVANSQRRLKTRLESIRQGLVGEDGASGIAAVGDKQAIDKLVAAVTDIQQAIDKAPLGDPVLLDELRAYHATLADKGAALDELLPAAAKPEAETPTGPVSEPSDGPEVDEPAADGPAVDGPAADGPVVDPAAEAPAP